MEGVGGEPQGGVAVVALEAAAVEELPLGAEALHHVHAPAAEEAHVAAPDVLGELLAQRVLRNHPPSPPKKTGLKNGQQERKLRTLVPS